MFYEKTKPSIDQAELELLKEGLPYSINPYQQ